MLKIGALVFVFFAISTSFCLFSFQEDYQKLPGEIYTSFPARDYSQYGFKKNLAEPENFEEEHLTDSQEENKNVLLWGSVENRLEIDSSTAREVRNPLEDEKDYYYKNQSGMTMVNTLKLNFLSHPQEKMETKISGIFRLETQRMEESDVAGKSYVRNLKDYYLKETYVGFLGERYTFKVGLLNFNYGIVEENSPLDIINPEDLYRYKLILKEERKEPLPAVSFDFFDSEYDFNTFFGFYHDSNRDADTDSIWRDYRRRKIDFWENEGLTKVIDLREEKKDKLTNFVAGGRLLKREKDYQWGLSYYYGWDYNNYYLGSNYRVLSGENIPREIDIENKRTSLIGVFGSAMWNDEVELKGELAYFIDSYFYNKYKNSLADDNLLNHSKIKGVFQVAHSFDETTRIVAEYIFTYVLDWDNAIDFPETTNEFYFHLKKEVLSKKVAFDIRAWKNFTRDDLYLRPRLYWETSRFKVGLGYDFLWGEDDRYGWGQFAQNDMAVFNLDYKF